MKPMLDMTSAQATETTATTKVCRKSEATTPQAPESTDTKITVTPMAMIVWLISASNTALVNTPKAFSQTPALREVETYNEIVVRNAWPSLLKMTDTFFDIQHTAAFFNFYNSSG